MGRTRRKFSSEENLKMVMVVIQDGKAVSDVAQKNNVHPNMILNWKKEFLENAAAVFDRHRHDITEKAQQRKICPYPQELPVRLTLPCLADDRQECSLCPPCKRLQHHETVRFSPQVG